MSVRQGPLYQSGSVAHPLSPPRHPELRQTAGRSVGSVRAGELQRLPAQRPCVRRQAAALSRDQGGLPGPCGRTARQGHATEFPRWRREQGRSGEAARVASRLGSARQGLRLRRERSEQRPPRLSKRARRRSDGATHPFQARGPRRSLGFQAVARDSGGRQLRHADHVVSARGRHGPDRRGLRPGARNRSFATTPR